MNDSFLLQQTKSVSKMTGEGRAALIRSKTAVVLGCKDKTNGRFLYHI
jgi:hypothetical protein